MVHQGTASNRIWPESGCAGTLPLVSFLVACRESDCPQAPLRSIRRNQMLRQLWVDPGNQLSEIAATHHFRSPYSRVRPTADMGAANPPHQRTS